MSIAAVVYSPAAYDLLCGIVTDEYGNRWQLLHGDGAEQSTLFWFDGFSDPDIFERHIKETTQ